VLYAIKSVASFSKVQYEHIKLRCGRLCSYVFVSNSSEHVSAKIYGNRMTSGNSVTYIKSVTSFLCEPDSCMYYIPTDLQ